MTIKALFPTVRPTLNLDFANSKVLDPRVTFTRASTGTFVGSNGLIQTAASNVPRFDHNPTTGESLGLLVEEARTNSVLRSEEFDDASWGKTNSSISANSTTSPNGTVTADTLVEDSSSATHPVLRSVNVTAGVTYTLSCYVKAAGRNFTQLLFVGGFASNITAIFSLTDGSVGTTGGAPVTTAVNAGNGWYRVSITATATTTTATSVQFRPAINSSSANYLGDGTSGIYLWGAQLEVGAFPTSYIPTTSSTATRAADVASMTGTNFSSWYNQTEGTFYSENRIGGFQANNYPNVFSANDGTGNNMIQNYRHDYAIRYTYNVVAGGVAQTSFNQSATIAAGAVAKMATAVATNNGILVVNGTEQGADSSLSMPTGINRLQILGGGDMTIKRLTYWPIRLPNTTLQAITTS